MTILGRFSVYILWGLVEWQNAPWLPWWRRYMGLTLSVAGDLLLLVNPRVSRCVNWIALIVYFWNCISAGINRRNGKNHRKLEASTAPEMTTVQRQQWMGQLQEAS